jgi:L-malate glycosyltransferase
MHEVVRDHELDLLHVHYAIPHATSAWIARSMLRGRRDMKVVTTLHGTDITHGGAGALVLHHHQVLDRAI